MTKVVSPKKDKIVLVCDRIIELCLYLVIFTSIFSKAAVESFFVLAVVAYLIKKVLSSSISKRRISLPTTKLDFPILALVTTNVISTMLSQDFLISLRYFFTLFLENIGFYLMALEVTLSKKNGREKSFIFAILIASIALTIDSIIQYSTGTDLFRSFHMAGRRLTASMGSPNTLAAWLILVIPLFYCWGILAKIKKLISRIGLIALGFLLTLCVFLTYSRSAWLGLICSLLFILLIVNNKRILLFSLVIIVFFLLLILLYPDSMIGFRTEYASYPIFIRLNLWKEATALIKDYPFFGVGLKNYLAMIPKYQIHQFDIPITQIGETTGISPHNGYLQMAAETGLVGLSCFLWMLWALFKNGVKHLKNDPDPILLGLLSGLLAFLVSAFFDNHLGKIELSAMFWIMLGFAAVLLRNREQNFPLKDTR